MNYSEVQTHLDIVKWHESEDHGMDMCRHMPYCEYCRGEEEYPCAKAYERMEQAKAEAEAKEVKKAKKAAAPKASESREEKGLIVNQKREKSPARAFFVGGNAVRKYRRRGNSCGGGRRRRGSGACDT